MVALRLVRLIETNSDKIAASLATTIHNAARNSAGQPLPKLDCLILVRDLLQQLREWLLSNRNAEIEAHYRETGARLAGQGIALAHAEAW